VIDDSEETDSDDEDEYDLPPDEMEDLVGDSDEEYESDELDGVDIIDRIKEVVDEDDEDEGAPALVPTKKGKNKRAAEDDADGLDDLIAKESAGATDEPKLSKKQQKKLKNNKGQAVEVEESKLKPAAKDKETNGTTKSDKKVQFAKELEQGPTGSAEKAKTAEGKASIGVKVVQGVTIDDRKIGTGRTVKAGDKVGMRYIGKLQNGKVFDCKPAYVV
jgi:FK506-binding nuclear protein